MNYDSYKRFSDIFIVDLKGNREILTGTTDWLLSVLIGRKSVGDDFTLWGRKEGRVTNSNYLLTPSLSRQPSL